MRESNQGDIRAASVDTQSLIPDSECVVARREHETSWRRLEGSRIQKTFGGVDFMANEAGGLPLRECMGKR